MSTHPYLSSPFRLVVQVVVPLKLLRDPLTRTHVVTRMLHSQASKDVGAYSGWTLGPITYKAEVRVPHGVIPKNRPHELDGAKCTEDQLDELVKQLDATGHVWVMVAGAEVIR